MIETLLTYLTGTVAGKAGLAALGLWALGMFAKSAAYRKVREWLGKAAYQGGVALSGLATAKLGRVTWGPIEAVLVDFLGFGIEQGLAGLRSDNVEKLEAQVERLEAVGSVTRVQALVEKVADLRPVGRDAARR